MTHTKLPWEVECRYHQPLEHSRVKMVLRSTPILCAVTDQLASPAPLGRAPSRQISEIYKVSRFHLKSEGERYLTGDMPTESPDKDSLDAQLYKRELGFL